MIVFLVTVLTILGLLHWFLYARLVIALDIVTPTVLWLLRLLAVLLAASYLIARSIERIAPEWLIHVAHWIASVWLGLMWQLLWITFLFFIVKLLLMLTGIWSRLDPDAIVALGRYSAAAAAALAVLICGFATARATRPRVIEAQVPVRAITPELRAMRIVMVSDFHAGIIVNRDEITRWAEQISRLNPDLILIPGDVIDGNVDHIIDFADAFHHLDAPLGVFVTTGNHEYYAGVQRSLEFYRAAGFHALMNEHAELPGGLVVAGIEDRTARQMGLPRPSVEEVLATVPKDRAVILLNHTPETQEALAAGRAGADLIISGHTHAGQMWPFWFFTRMAFRFQHGLYNLPKGYILTSCGIGTWGPPMRLFAPPEIVLIKLVGEDETPRIGRARREG
jgi:uncharacterized protein